jgi:hypothetical protein
MSFSENKLLNYLTYQRITSETDNRLSSIQNKKIVIITNG